MGGAWIDGRPVTLEAAVAEAARLLGASRLPVIAGLGTDIGGARAAVLLAQRRGGAIDHMGAGSLLRDIDVLREAGVMMTTPSEAGLRADTLLLVGPGLTFAWPELGARLIGAKAGRETGEGFARRVRWLCPGRDGAEMRKRAENVRTVGDDPLDLTALVAALRARVAGRPIGKAPLAAKALDALAADLQAARFGVAVWSAAMLDALTIEMLCGLIDDLNAKTRFTGLPLMPGDNAPGVLHACGWMTGVPMRTGFGRGYPEHDPWRFAAARLVESGEADCALWISAYRPSAPDWLGDVATIALTADAATFRPVPRVQIVVGRPGVDHDCVEHNAAIGTLASVAATRPTDVVSVAAVIGKIAAALPGSQPC